MNKFFYTLIIIAMIFTSCISSKQYLENRQYDLAIARSSHRLMKNPNNLKQLDVLRRAWEAANRQDNEKINYLRTTGQPEIWSEVFYTYINMKNRQDVVRNLPQQVLSAIGYEYVDYTDKTVNAQKNAAEFYYQKGINLLKEGDRFLARQAYAELNKTKQFFNSYKDVDKQILRAREMGTSNVLFISKNNSGQILPEGFLDEILKISLGDIERLFVKFYSNFDASRTYHYKVILNLTRVDVSPESVQNNFYEESKEVQDGWNYVLDKNGNVMKDTSGNDIKTPRMVKVVCKVHETQLLKKAIVGGYLDIYSHDNILLRSDPITAETFFNHVYATANGDINVLSEATKKKLKNRPAPFPSSFQMIWDASSIVKNIAKDILVRNSHIFQ
ncbi:MAG: hypothetical protein GX259_08630 [Bacteroidales bacterium]|nr:hypothetical protein [Bacteroidales bacterium]